MAQFFEVSKGKVFVAGLVWQALPGTSGQQKVEVRKLSLELDLDMVVWRHGTVMQVGLGSLSDGIKTGYYSAAAVISKAMEVELGARSFLAAVRVPGDRFLYVAQREGTIVPNGDFVGTEDEVRLRLAEDRSIGDVEKIICPDFWGVRNAEERDFLSFLPSKNGVPAYSSWWAMRPVKGDVLRKLVPLVLIACVLIGAVFGIKSWQAKKQQEELAALEAMQATTDGTQVKAPHPWKTQGAPVLVVKNCLQAFMSVPTLEPGNWTLTGASCTNGAMVISWRRGSAWLDHLLAAMPSAMVGPDGNSASFTKSFSMTDGADDESVPTSNSVIQLMQSYSQRLGVQITLTPRANAQMLLPGQTPNQPPVVKDWAEMTWEAKEFSLSPESLISMISGPGLRVEEIHAAFNAGSLKWSMKGTQYVQP